jgi:hypothetical protein
MNSVPCFLAMLLAALLPSLEAQACPDCAEGIRQQVHAAIFDETFARNLIIMALPFGVLAAITAAILVVPSGRRRRRG